MKKLFLGWSALSALVIFIACDNKKTNAEPEQDTDFVTTQEASYANSIAIEVAQLAAYMGEGQYSTKYLDKLPSSGGAYTSTIIASNRWRITYTGNPTCYDGKKRNGTVEIEFSSNPPLQAANNFRDPGYVGKLYFYNYMVDSVKIYNEDDLNPFQVHNVTDFAYVPATTNLKWNIQGKLKMDNLKDGTKNMTWDGKFEEILANTSNTVVFASSKLINIAWSSTNTANCAKLEYTGSSKGTINSGEAYTFSVTESPLVRNYACSPDKVVSFNMSPTLTPVYSEWHPVISGITSFTFGSKEPRRVDYSNEGNPDCDNSCKVMIKGIDTPVTLKK